MIVVKPDIDRILPAIVLIKAGVCSDLVIDHQTAHYILNDKNNEILKINIWWHSQNKGITPIAALMYVKEFFEMW